MRNESELARIEKAVQGHMPSFEGLVKEHQVSVLRYLRAILKNPADAEDAFQQTFLIVYQKLQTFQGNSSLRTWIFTIAKRNALGIIRKESSHTTKKQSLMELGLEAGWSSDQPDLAAQKAQSKKLLERALAALKPDYREILVLRELESMSGEETAKILELTIPAMKTRLHRARLALAARLRKEVEV